MTVPCLAPTSVHRLFGIENLNADGTRMTGHMRTGSWSAGPDGRPALGALGALIDEVLGYSIIASLPPGGWSVSTEIWIDLVAGLPASGTDLRAEGDIVVPASFASGRVLDETGRVIAVCRERGLEIGQRPADATGLAVPPLRPGPVSRADLADRLDLRAEGDAFVLEVTPEVANPIGVLHGGISLAASEVAATWSRHLAGSRLAARSLHIVHTRPVPMGARLILHPRTVHAGRSLWLTDVDAVVDGRICASTRVTAG